MSQKTTPVPNPKSGVGFQDKVVWAFLFQPLELYILWMQQVTCFKPNATAYGLLRLKGGQQKRTTCMNQKQQKLERAPFPFKVEQREAESRREPIKT